MISRKNNWPDAFKHRIEKQFPDTSQSFINALDHQAKVSVRLNPTKSNLSLTNESVPWSQYAYFLEERPVFAIDPLWHAGAYYVQEASSMFLEQAFKQIQIEGPKLVLDLCAAPGGKSTHINSLLNPEDLLVANEVIRSRVPVLIENLTKWGHPNFLVSNSDAKNFGDIGGLFDVLVIDAPCSGEGLFRRDPEAAKEWSEENANLCSVRQRRILAESWDCLKNDGYLIYSTCTFNPEENEENLDWLKNQGDFESISIPLKPEWNIDEVEYKGIHGYRFLPHRSKGEGFFISILKKTNDSASVKFPKRFKIKLQKPTTIPMDWLNHPENYKFFQHQDQLKIIPQQWEREILLLFEKIKLVKSGINLGLFKKNTLLPEHDLAMSTDLNLDTFECINLDLNQARNYLSRNVFPLTMNKTNWQLVCFQNTPLGFIKNLGNRFNNYYPKEWRLRMQSTEDAKIWHML